jgi:hypothetical protein
MGVLQMGVLQMGVLQMGVLQHDAASANVAAVASPIQKVAWAVAPLVSNIRKQGSELDGLKGGDTTRPEVV